MRHDLEAAGVIEEVYENERCYPLRGWSKELLSDDVPPYSTKDGLPSPPQGEVPLPPEWEWMDNWRPCLDDATDAEGFVYAYDFANPGQWYPNCRWNSHVRRRKWIRSRRRQVFTALPPEDVLRAQRLGRPYPSVSSSELIPSLSLSSQHSASACRHESESSASSSSSVAALSPAPANGEEVFGLDAYLPATGNAAAAPGADLAGPPALPTSPPAAASPLDSALNRSPAPTPPPRAPQRSSGGDTESICTTHSSDVDVLAALPNAAGEYLQHLRLCDVEKAIAEATQLHEAGQFRTAASKFILCTELLSGLLRRILQGNAVLQDAGGQEVHPELVFRQLQVCSEFMQHIFLKIHQHRSPQQQRTDRARSVPPSPSGEAARQPVRRKGPLRKGIQVARAKMLPWASKWHLFVLQHYDWQGAVLQQHNAFVTALEQDPENPVLVHEHLLWLLGTPGSPLCSALAAFALSFKEQYGGDWADAGEEELRHKLDGAKGDMEHFQNALVEYSQSRLFPNVDTVTGETFLPTLLDRELQGRVHGAVMGLYHALHGRQDAKLNALIESGVEPAFYTSIPPEYHREFRPVSDILSRLPLYPHSDAKLCCIVDAIRRIHTCLDQPPTPERPPDPDPAPDLDLRSGSQGDPDDCPDHNTNRQPDPGPASAPEGHTPRDPGPDPTPNLDPDPQPNAAATGSAVPPSPQGLRLEGFAATECHSQASDMTAACSLGADVMLPIFIYCLLGSQVPNLWSQAEYLQGFIKDSQSRGHHGYCLVTLQSALVFLLQRAGEGGLSYR